MTDHLVELRERACSSRAMARLTARMHEAIDRGLVELSAALASALASKPCPETILDTIESSEGAIARAQEAELQHRDSVEVAQLAPQYLEKKKELDEVVAELERASDALDAMTDEERAGGAADWALASLSGYREQVSVDLGSLKERLFRPAQ